MVEQWLGERGLAREIVYTTPNYLQAAHIVASSDLVVVLPTRLARYYSALLPLQVHELPFELGPFHLDVVSLELRQREKALQWLIEQIIALGRGVSA